MPAVSLEEMLKSGVHFGHKLGRLYPKMKPFIFGERNGISIIDLEKTKQKIEAAQEYIKGIARKNGTLLMIGTKRQAQEIVKKYASSIQMPYITGRWIGGAFTNFSVISKMIIKFTKLKKEREQGELEKYTKKEQLKIDEEITKLDSFIGGIESLKKLPDAVYIVDVKNEMTAVREAKKKKIPIIAIVDVNNSPEGIDYVIPANDDATKAIEYITRVLTESFKEGMAEKKEETEIKEEVKK